MVSHYRLEEAVGRGAVGRVYRAWDTGLDCPVALKFLRPELADDSSAVERFVREARLAASLEHPHVCTVNAIDRDEDGRWYIAMRWYGGGTLKERLAAGPLPPDEAVRYARQTALGLACAHRHHIVHRDIKPANIILDEDGGVKILDFGVAALMDAARLTRRGAAVGTAGYLAPEQARGEEPSARSDIWAVGVLLHEMLTGRLPFRGDYEAAQLYSVVHEQPTPLPAELGAVGTRCQAVIDRCLAKDPDARYATAEDLSAALAEVAGDSTVVTGASAAVRPPGRMRWMLAGAAVFLALAVMSAVWGQSLLVRLGVVAPAIDERGVAVLPVTFADPGGGALELGAGFGWFLSDRLSRLEGRTDAFWVVPPGDVTKLAAASDADAQRLFGVRRTLRGVGRLEGPNLTVDFTYHDGWTGRHVTRRFSDDLANLATWQRDVPAWVAGILDEDLVAAAAAVPGPHYTTVPSAFWSWLRGIGLAWLPAAARDDSLLARGVAQLAEAVGQDSSFVCARADWGWARYRLDRDTAPERRQRDLAALTRASTMAPDAVWPRIYQAHLAQRSGNAAEAVALYDSVLVRDPVNHAGLTGRAAALAALGRTAPAAADYARALRQRPDYAPLLVDVGRFRYYHGDFTGARDAFARAVKVTPDNDRAWYVLGAARFELEDLDGAETAFHQALALKPSFVVLSNLGTLAYYRERYADAAGFYRRALAYGPSYTAWKHLAEAWRWQVGYADSSRQAYQRAADLAAEAVDRAEAPAWDVMAELATFRSALGDSAGAAALIDRITRAAPPLEYDAQFYLAVACEDLGRREEALAWLARAFAAGLPTERPDHYPGFRNLRADARYHALVAHRDGTS